jgi:hypothetical protein
VRLCVVLISFVMTNEIEIAIIAEPLMSFEDLLSVAWRCCRATNFGQGSCHHILYIYILSSINTSVLLH